MKKGQVKTRKKWKVVDEYGNTVKTGYKTFSSAIRDLPKLRLNKKDWMEVIEE